MRKDDRPGIDLERLRAWEKERERKSPHRWQLEMQGADGEMYAFPGGSDVTSILDCLGRFDDDTTLCCLMDCADGSALWCWGEPDRRVVEIFEAPTKVNGVIARASDGRAVAANVRVRDDDASKSCAVVSDEVLTRAECDAIFTAFRTRDHALPDGYGVRARSYFFRVLRDAEQERRPPY